MSKKSYFTKADLINFGTFLLSDERRLIKQREAREAFKNGVINPKPWSVTERMLTPQDFEDWKNSRKK